jgi:hypothetical protein
MTDKKQRFGNLSSDRTHDVTAKLAHFQSKRSRHQRRLSRRGGLSGIDTVC